MLSGEHDRMDTGGLPVNVFHRDLAFRVGAEPINVIGEPQGSDFIHEPMCKLDGGGMSSSVSLQANPNIIP